MKSDIKQQWIEALSSGDYRQGRSRLRTNDDEYCCLGVLCDLAVKAGAAKWEQKDEGGLNPVWYCVALDDSDVSDATLLSVVRDWAGLESDNPHVDIGIANQGLAHINDSGRGFSKIAALIEEQL